MSLSELYSQVGAGAGGCGRARDAGGCGASPPPAASAEPRTSCWRKFAAGAPRAPPGGAVSLSASCGRGDSPPPGARVAGTPEVSEAPSLPGTWGGPPSGWREGVPTWRQGCGGEGGVGARRSEWCSQLPGARPAVTTPGSALPAAASLRGTEGFPVPPGWVDAGYRGGGQAPRFHAAAAGELPQPPPSTVRSPGALACPLCAGQRSRAFQDAPSPPSS